MPNSEGDRLPDTEVIRATPDGPEATTMQALTAGRRVVVFALPGAFTPTCDSAHLPSFIRTAEQFRAKGIDDLICLSVNDAHVMRVWGDVTGATEAGITMIADPQAAFTKAMGKTFSNPVAGLHDRSSRYAMLVEDGIVTKMHVEEIGVCAVSTGEAMLEVV